MQRISLGTSWRMSGQDTHAPLKPTFSHHSCEGHSLCMIMWAEWERCTTTPLEEQTSYRSVTEKVLQSVDCLPPAHNRQQRLLWVGWFGSSVLFFGCPLEHLHWTKGEEFNVEGLGKCGCQCQQSYGRGTEHNGESCWIWLATTNWTNLSSFYRLQAQNSGAWNGSARLHINFWGDPFALNTDVVRTPGIPM